MTGSYHRGIVIVADWAGRPRSAAELVAHEAPHDDVLAEASDALLDQIPNGLAAVADIWLVQQRRGAVGRLGLALDRLSADPRRIHRCNLHGDLVRELAELGVAGHEVGLAVHLDQGSHPATGMDVGFDETLPGLAG